jgi:membrane protein required for colicin V production
MTWIDWVIVMVMALSVLGGVKQGFLRSVFSLGGLIAGLALAIWNYARVAAFLIHLVRFEAVADTIAFLLIAMLVMGVAAMLGTMLSKILHKVGLGCLDRLAGAVFGFFQGALLVTLGILITLAFFPNEHFLAKGRLPKVFFGACHLSTHVSPEALAKRVRLGLKTLEEDSPKWLHPDHVGL